MTKLKTCMFCGGTIMSFEGYERGLCKNGHLHSADCYVGIPEKCPECGEPFVWSEIVDQTNDSGKPTKLKVKSKIPYKAVVYRYTYHIPKGEGHDK